MALREAWDVHTGLNGAWTVVTAMRDKVIAHRVWNFHTLKNNYNLTLCQSRLHTASETFVRHKKN